jgi:hypothetical protein
VVLANAHASITGRLHLPRIRTLGTPEKKEETPQRQRGGEKK